jgi:hypothetical protein
MPTPIGYTELLIVGQESETLQLTAKSMRRKILIAGVQLAVFSVLGIMVYLALRPSRAPGRGSGGATETRGAGITNGDFEDGTAGWQGGNANLRTTKGGQTGNCLELDATGGTFQYAIQWEIGTLNRGDSYELAFWVKSGTAGDEPFTVGVWDRTANRWMAAESGKSSGSWAGYSLRFSPGANHQVAFEIMKISSKTGTILFDSVSLYPVGENLLQNGEFELGTSGWVGGGADITTIEGGNTGECLALAAKDKLRSVMQQGIDLKASINYDLRFSVKSGTSGDQPFTVGIWDPKKAAWIASLDGRSTGAWVSYTLHFLNSSRRTAAVELINRSAGMGTMLYDSIALQKHR